MSSRLRLGTESLDHYLIRERSAFDRYSNLRDRFSSWDCPEFRRFMDTEGILFYREMQEAGVPFPRWMDMLTVGGETDLRVFLQKGYECYTRVAAVAQTLPRDARVLDFGVGCGRTIRFFYRDCAVFEFHGCDVDSSSIEYMQREVPFVSAIRSENSPPLPYASGLFDLIYCISVFTHFTRTAIVDWLHELGRVVKPGGTLALTLHGEHAFRKVDSDPAWRRLITVHEDQFAAGRGNFLEHGFVFAEQGVGSADIDRQQYGINFVTLAAFQSIVQSDFELDVYEPGRIDDWQDFAILRRKS